MPKHINIFISLVQTFLMIHSYKNFDLNFIKISHFGKRRIFSNKYQTEIEMPIAKFKIHHGEQVLFLGSCFSETISDELKQRKFKVFSNPQGILFNPLSISSCIERLVEKKFFTQSDLFLDKIDGDTYHSWFHGREFSGIDQEDVLNNINHQIEIGHSHIKNSKALFITLGTSVVYKLISENLIVSNCHKQPGKLFEKRILNVNEIQDCLLNAFKMLKDFNKNINIVITISPIRHVRDTLITNSISKSALIYSTHSIANIFDYVTYFPSYEIMMDELRDYRWYTLYNPLI